MLRLVYFVEEIFDFIVVNLLMLSIVGLFVLISFEFEGAIAIVEVIKVKVAIEAVI